jgi:hypothetical protein
VPLHSHFSVLASSVDSAITNRFQVKQLRYETTTQRDEEYTEATGKPVNSALGKPDLQDGDICIVITNKRQFSWNLDGTTGKWVATAKRFAFDSIAKRDEILGIDLYEGDTCYVADINVEYYWDGSAWVDQDISGAAWVAWTPTIAGWTGATVNYARYKQYGKTIHYEIKVTGSTTAPSTFTITPPVAANTTFAEADALAGVGLLRMGSLYQVTNVWTSSTLWRPATITSAVAAVGYISSTSPATYASGAIIRITGTYEAA